jgi:subtilisin family serine protease
MSLRRIVLFLFVAMLGAAAGPVVAEADQTGRQATERAELGAGVPSTAAAALSGAAGAPLDLLVTFDEPASPTLVRRLATVGSGVWTARHYPVGAVRIPAARLEALRRVAGVRGVYLDKVLSYFGDRAVTPNMIGAADGPLPVPLPGQAPPGGFGAALPIPGLGVTGKGVTVAVIDSGIDFTHPDLADAMVVNVKMSPLGSDGPLQPIEGLPNTDNTSGHGTHVAGDVAGRGIASGGTYQGAAPGASLVGIGAGEGLTVHTRAVLQSYDWLLEHRQKYGIRAVNNSFGGGFEPFNPDEPIHRATKAATDAGIVVLFAQGNDGDEMTMNGSAVAPWVIAVAAGTQQGGMTDFSSGGLDADVSEPLAFDVRDMPGDPRRPLRMGLYHPSFAALGEFVVGARAIGTVLPALGARHDLALPAGDQARYTIMSGTSMASPEAAGIVALVLEANSDLRPLDVKRVLQSTARWIADVPFFRQGYGHVDPARAVELARRLRGLPSAEVNRILDEEQAKRDAEILAGMRHPLRTTAWSKEEPSAEEAVPGHAITVEPGAARLKVVNAGFGLPLVSNPLRMIVVRDAAGREVGRSAQRLPGGSGTTVLDLDLAKLTGVTWGKWTVEVSEGGLLPVGSLGPPEATVAATFAEAGKPDPLSSIVPDSLPVPPAPPG